MRGRRWVGITTSVMLLIQLFCISGWAQEAEDEASSVPAEMSAEEEMLDYEAYQELHGGLIASPGESLVVAAEQEDSPDVEFIHGYEGYESNNGNTGCFLTKTEGTVHYRFRILSDGFYTITFFALSLTL